MDGVTCERAQQPAVTHPPSQVLNSSSDEVSSALGSQPCSTAQSHSCHDPEAAAAVLATIQEETQTTSVCSPDHIDAPRTLIPCQSGVGVTSASPPPANAGDPQACTTARPKRSTSIKSHWPNTEEISRSSTVLQSVLPAREMAPNPRHAWHYGTYTTATASCAHGTMRRGKEEDGLAMMPNKRHQPGSDRLGMLGKQHLLALADTQLPELGLDSIKREHIRFETGSGSGGGSGSSRETGVDSGSGGIVDNRNALSSVHAHTRDANNGWKGAVGVAAGPVELSDSTPRSRHNPVPAVPRRNDSAELTWLQLASSMEMISLPEDKKLPAGPLSPLPRARPKKFFNSSLSSDDEATFSTMVVATNATGRLTTASDCKDAFLRAGVAPPPGHAHMVIQQDSGRMCAALPAAKPLPPAMLALTGNCISRDPSVNSAGSSERFFQVIGTDKDLLQSSDSRQPSYLHEHKISLSGTIGSTCHENESPMIYSNDLMDQPAAPQIPLRSRETSDESGECTPTSTEGQIQVSINSTKMPLHPHPRSQQPYPTRQLSGVSDTEHVTQVEVGKGTFTVSRANSNSGYAATSAPGEEASLEHVLDGQGLSNVPAGLRPVRVSRDAAPNTLATAATSEHTSIDAEMAHPPWERVAGCSSQPQKGVVIQENNVDVLTTSATSGGSVPGDLQSQRATNCDACSNESIAHEPMHASAAHIQDSTPFNAGPRSMLLSNATDQSTSSLEAFTSTKPPVDSLPHMQYAAASAATISHSSGSPHNALSSALANSMQASSVRTSFPSTLSEGISMAAIEPSTDIPSGTDFAPTTATVQSNVDEILQNSSGSGVSDCIGPSEVPSSDKADIEPFAVQECHEDACAMALAADGSEHHTKPLSRATTCSSSSTSGQISTTSQEAVHAVSHVVSTDSTLRHQDIDTLQEQGLPAATLGGLLKVQEQTEVPESMVPDASASSSVDQPPEHLDEDSAAPQHTDMHNIIDVQCLTPTKSLVVWPASQPDAAADFSDTATRVVHSAHRMQSMVGITSSSPDQPQQDPGVNNSTLSLQCFPQNPLSSRGGTLRQSASGRSTQSSTHSTSNVRGVSNSASFAEMGVTGTEASAECPIVFQQSTDGSVEETSTSLQRERLSSIDASATGFDTGGERQDAGFTSIPQQLETGSKVSNSNEHTEVEHDALLQAGSQVGTFEAQEPVSCEPYQLQDSPVADDYSSEPTCSSEPPSLGVTTCPFQLLVPQQQATPNGRLSSEHDLLDIEQPEIHASCEPSSEHPSTIPFSTSNAFEHISTPYHISTDSAAVLSNDVANNSIKHPPTLVLEASKSWDRAAEERVHVSSHQSGVENTAGSAESIADVSASDAALVEEDSSPPALLQSSPTCQEAAHSPSPRGISPASGGGVADEDSAALPESSGRLTGHLHASLTALHSSNMAGPGAFMSGAMSSSGVASNGITNSARCSLFGTTFSTASKWSLEGSEQSESCETVTNDGPQLDGASAGMYRGHTLREQWATAGQQTEQAHHQVLMKELLSAVALNDSEGHDNEESLAAVMDAAVADPADVTCTSDNDEALRRAFDCVDATAIATDTDIHDYHDKDVHNEDYPDDVRNSEPNRLEADNQSAQSSVASPNEPTDVRSTTGSSSTICEPDYTTEPPLACSLSAVEGSAPLSPHSDASNLSSGAPQQIASTTTLVADDAPRESSDSLSQATSYAAASGVIGSAQQTLSSALETDHQTHQAYDEHHQDTRMSGGMLDHPAFSPYAAIADQTRPASAAASQQNHTTNSDGQPDFMHDDALTENCLGRYEVEYVADAHLYYQISVSSVATSDATSISALHSSEEMWTTRGTELNTVGSPENSSDTIPSSEPSLDKPLEMHTSGITGRASGSAEAGRRGSVDGDGERGAAEAGRGSGSVDGGTGSCPTEVGKGTVLLDAGCSHGSVAHMSPGSSSSYSPSISEAYYSEHDDSTSRSASTRSEFVNATSRCHGAAAQQDIQNQETLSSQQGMQVSPPADQHGVGPWRESTSASGLSIIPEGDRSSAHNSHSSGSTRRLISNEGGNLFSTAGIGSEHHNIGDHTGVSASVGTSVGLTAELFADRTAPLIAQNCSVPASSSHGSHSTNSRCGSSGGAAARRSPGSPGNLEGDISSGTDIIRDVQDALLQHNLNDTHKHNIGNAATEEAISAQIMRGDGGESIGLVRLEDASQAVCGQLVDADIKSEAAKDESDADNDPTAAHSGAVFCAQDASAGRTQRHLFSHSPQHSDTPPEMTTSFVHGCNDVAVGSSIRDAQASVHCGHAVNTEGVSDVAEKHKESSGSWQVQQLDSERDLNVALIQEGSGQPVCMHAENKGSANLEAYMIEAPPPSGKQHEISACSISISGTGSMACADEYVHATSTSTESIPLASEEEEGASQSLANASQDNTTTLPMEQPAAGASRDSNLAEELPSSCATSPPCTVDADSYLEYLMEVSGASTVEELEARSTDVESPPLTSPHQLNGARFPEEASSRGTLGEIPWHRLEIVCAPPMHGVRSPNSHSPQARSPPTVLPRPCRPPKPRTPTAGSISPASGSAAEVSSPSMSPTRASSTQHMRACSLEEFTPTPLASQPAQQHHVSSGGMLLDTAAEHQTSHSQVQSAAVSLPSQQNYAAAAATFATASEQTSQSTAVAAMSSTSLQPYESSNPSSSFLGDSDAVLFHVTGTFMGFPEETPSRVTSIAEEVSDSGLQVTESANSLPSASCATTDVPPRDGQVASVPAQLQEEGIPGTDALAVSPETAAVQHPGNTEPGEASRAAVSQLSSLSPVSVDDLSECAASHTHATSRDARLLGAQPIAQTSVSVLDLDSSVDQITNLETASVHASAGQNGWQQHLGVAQSSSRADVASMPHAHGTLMHASICAAGGQESASSTLASNQCSAGWYHSHGDGSTDSHTNHRDDDDARPVKEALEEAQRTSTFSVGDIQEISETCSKRQPEGQQNVAPVGRGIGQRSTIFFPGVFPDEMEVLYGTDRARAHGLAMRKLEHSEVMTALQASAVQDGASYVIVIHAGGLALADVSLSTDEGGRDARILVHMRQSSLLLQALDAQKSQVVDSRTFLTEDKTYRVTVALPNSVVGVSDMQPEPLGTFFTWRVSFFQDPNSSPAPDASTPP